MTTVELVTALMEGKLLEKDFAKVNFDYNIPGENMMYLFSYKSGEDNAFEVKGWGSYRALNSSLLELLNEPQYWEVSKFTIEDRPWSK